MKIVLLSQRPHLYSTKRLFESARIRGHSVLVMDTLSSQLTLSDAGPGIEYRGEEINNYDAVIPRIGASTTYYGIAVLRQFELMGTYCINSAESVAQSRDKLRCLQILASKGIAIPASCFSKFPHLSEKISGILKGPPVIIKLTEGTQGLGVMLAETYKSAESIIEGFGTLDAPVLSQEYIVESKGRDIRCLVVGNEVVASMERQNTFSDFRSNLHRGAMAKPVSITGEEKAIVLRAAAALGLKVAGVDLLRSARGPLVIEVNSSPGLEGIEKTSGTEIAEKIIEFIELETCSRLPEENLQSAE